MVRRRVPESSPPAPKPGGARMAALRLLNRRDYSVAEISNRLIDRGHDPAEVDEAVAGLCADKLLDDARVARAHARTASAIKGRGRHRIRRELEARGLSRSDAEAATAELTPSDEQTTLERLIARATLGGPLDRDTEHRLFQRLMRRGFDADAIRRALKGVRS
jgi:regulatory protein